MQLKEDHFSISIYILMIALLIILGCPWKITLILIACPIVFIGACFLMRYIENRGGQ